MERLRWNHSTGNQKTAWTAKIFNINSKALKRSGDIIPRNCPSPLYSGEGRARLS